jgi:hypothetical protein
MDRSHENDSSAGADTPTLRSSHALPQERTKLMAKVTHSPPETMPEAAAEDRDAVIAGATRIFRDIGARGTGRRDGRGRRYGWCGVMSSSTGSQHADGEHPQDPAEPTPGPVLLAEIEAEGLAAWFARNGVTTEQLWEWAAALEAAVAAETPGGES